MKEKGIKAEDVKILPPIEEILGLIHHHYQGGRGKFFNEIQ